MTACPKSGFRPVPGERRADRSGSGGSVMMEYAVVTCLVAVALLSFMQKAVFVGGTPVSGFFNAVDGYVGLGVDWAATVQVAHRAVAMPIP